MNIDAAIKNSAHSMSWDILPRKTSPEKRMVKVQNHAAIKSIGKRPLENLKQSNPDHEVALRFLNERKAEVNEKSNKAGSINLLTPCRL